MKEQVGESAQGQSVPMFGRWDEVTSSTRMLEGLMGTIEKLIASAGQQAPQIREDAQRLEELQRRLNSAEE